ncbi:MAG: sugar phosphate isomerase/epimerase [Pseudonocardia sp.]|nr:sugar phosphate isomerase/epimerase [Pseudonocardia sp.]
MTLTTARAGRDVYFSFFMFTADLRPDDRAYTATIVRHIKELQSYGYNGFDLPIAPPSGSLDSKAELESYLGLKRALDDAGLGDVPFSTNVAVTRTFNPASPYREQREAAAAYLRSRVDITAALGGSLLAGAIIFPYNVYPVTDSGEPVWSDALQAWSRPGYGHAREVLREVGDYAGERGVTLGIEPVDHWETPAPNLVGEVADFLDHVPSSSVGVCIDSSHVVLGSEGPAVFRAQVQRLATGSRIHSIHISAPDRGALADSWIPWDGFLGPVLAHYAGPLLVEVFNAVPAFLNSFRLTRPKFWIPGEDAPVRGVLDAYTVAADGLATVRAELAKRVPPADDTKGKTP